MPPLHDKIYIYGKHALSEALRHAPQTIKKVFLSPDMEDHELRELLGKRHVPVALLKSKEVSRMVGQDTSHQGVIAIADVGALMVDFKDFATALKPSADTLLILLDELTDPHNVGAIIRSAAAFGVAGVLIPSHNQSPVTGAVAKASAGMIFRVPLVAIGNVNYTIGQLKNEGFRAYGLAMKGARDITQEKFDAPSLVVVGNEGRGIRQKTLELCDVTLSIPMHPRCESLNASVSAAVVLYAWSTAHGEALRNG